MLNSNKENTLRQEDVYTESIALLPPQYNDPAWKALWLAYESGEINLDTYLSLTRDFGFLPF